MGTDRTPENLRGFIIPHDITADNIWTTESTYTTRDSKPKQPTPGGDYDLGLSAAGLFTSTSSIRIQTQRAGHIERASFVWRETTETDSYGYNPPNVLERWDSIIDGTAAAADRYILLDCLGGDNGTSLFLYQQKDSIANKRYIRVGRRAIDGTITLSSIIYEQTSTSTPTLYGGITQLADGSILIAYMTSDGNTANIETARSFDGENWFVISRSCLPTDIDLAGSFGAGNTGYDSIERIRISESRGEILLLLATNAHNTSFKTNTILQYVSTDNGCSFVFIQENRSASFGFFRPDIVVKNNVFHVGFIATEFIAKMQPLESATIPIQTAESIGNEALNPGEEQIAQTGPNNNYQNADLALWTNETGRIFCVINQYTSKLSILQSDDARTFVYLGGNPTSQFLAGSQFYNIADTGSKPTTIAGCNARGTNHLYHNYDKIGLSNVNGLHLFELGGYSTVNAPAVKQYPKSFDYGGFDRTWVAYDAPQSTTEYTLVGTGGSVTSFPTFAKFVSTSGNNQYVRSTAITTTSTEGIIFRTRLRSVSQGHSTSGRGVEIITTNNKVTIWINTTGINVYDQLASASLATNTFNTTVQFELLGAIASNKIKLWKRETATAKEKRWTLVVSATLNSTGSAANQYVQYGHITATSGAGSDTETEWYEMHFSNGSRTGVQLESQTNPEDLNARQYPPKGKFVYVTGGTMISTFDGPAYDGEFYTIEQDSDFPIRRIFHSNSPTPRQTYRSNNTTEQKFAFFLDTSVLDNANCDLGSDSIGLYLSNINFRTFDVHKYNATTSSWNSIGSVNNKLGPTTWERKGNAVFSTNSGTTGQYVELDELKGYSMDIGSGVVRKVKGNSPGYLTNTTTSKRAAIFLENVQNSDPTTIGTGYLIPVSYTHLTLPTKLAV